MDWETEILKLLKILDPQVVGAVLILTEVIKRTLWRSLEWSKPYLLWVPIILAFPLCYLLGGVNIHKMSWQAIFRQGLFTGLAADLIYRSIEPKIKQWLGDNGGGDGGNGPGAK